MTNYFNTTNKIATNLVFKRLNTLHTYTVIEFLTDNPILFIALIIFTAFWIIFAVYYLIKNRRGNKSKEKLPACKTKSTRTV